MKEIKIKGRIHQSVPINEVKPGDIITYCDTCRRTRTVVSVSPQTVVVDQPKGLRPLTKRISRKKITECWRWHKEVDSVEV